MALVIFGTLLRFEISESVIESIGNKDIEQIKIKEISYHCTAYKLYFVYSHFSHFYIYFVFFTPIKFMT